MRNIFLGIVLAMVVVFGLRYCEYQKEENEQLNASTSLIEKQLKNVGKLVVTEGNFSQIYTYSDTKNLLMGLVDSKKKALVVANAQASISYDLSKIKAEIIPESKTVLITEIPQPELKINPNIEYYDVTFEYLNPFEAEDYNEIKKRVTALLREKIEASSLRTNAENRLISELQKIYILTNSMGWKLQYSEKRINTENDFDGLIL